MRAWYIPSFNGDLRLEPCPDNAEQTILTIVKPTPHELEILKALQVRFLEERWIERPFPAAGKRKMRTAIINASVATLGPVVSKIMRPGDAVLTAIALKDGKMITSSGSEAELTETVKEAVAEGAKDLTKAPEKAVTQKRPTPSCPNCIEGAVGPASEVLLSFLSPEQHETWAAHRYIVVEGHLSGNRYRIAHRNTPLAQHQTRICFDLDDRQVVHFHDHTVPPEEEVLAAMLIMQHREPWLRNEATLCFAPKHVLRFKNPFGGRLDGVPDAVLTRSVGAGAVGGLIGRTVGRFLA